MSDFLIRGVLPDLNVRFAWCGGRELCNTGVVIHDTDPLAAPVFCDALLGAALLSVLLTGREKYSVRWAYPGVIGSLLADVNARGDVRALLTQPHPATETDRVEELMGAGDGTVTVVKSEEGKVLNSGECRAGLALPSADLGLFFSLSDQIETELTTVSRFAPDPARPVRLAAGFLTQALPGCDLERFAELREKLHQAEFKDLLIAEREPFEKRLKAMLRVLAPESAGQAVYEFGPEPGFRCSCSREAMRRALLTLGEAELKKLFTEQPEPEITCNFCLQRYRFREQDFF